MRRWTVGAALGLVPVALTACTPAPATLAGTVLDQPVLLVAPQLPVPAVNTDAGFAPTASPSAALPSGTPAVPVPSAATAATTYVRVDSSARTGDRVAAGDVVVRLDDRAAVAAVAAARADADVARAQADALVARGNDARSRRSDLRANRAEVDTAIADLTATRDRLAAQLDRARTAAAGRTDATRSAPAAASAPSAGPVASGATPAALVRQLATALTAVDTGLANARSARSRLDSADATLTDAIRQLGDAAELARLAADGSDVAVRLTEEQAGRTTITSPVAGVVTTSVAAGDVVAAGATLVAVRPDGQSTVTTWVSPAGAAGLCAGTGATVSADWLPGNRHATVTAIGARAEYPETSYAGSDVHLTRAVPVRLSVDGDALPPGAPLDLTLDSCPSSPKDR